MAKARQNRGHRRLGEQLGARSGGVFRKLDGELAGIFPKELPRRFRSPRKVEGQEGVAGADRVAAELRIEDKLPAGDAEDADPVSSRCGCGIAGRVVAELEPALPHREIAAALEQRLRLAVRHNRHHAGPVFVEREPGAAVDPDGAAVAAAGEAGGGPKLHAVIALQDDIEDAAKRVRPVNSAGGSGPCLDALNRRQRDAVDVRLAEIELPGREARHPPAVNEDEAAKRAQAAKVERRAGVPAAKHLARRDGLDVQRFAASDQLFDVVAMGPLDVPPGQHAVRLDVVPCPPDVRILRAASNHEDFGNRLFRRRLIGGGQGVDDEGATRGAAEAKPRTGEQAAQGQIGCEAPPQPRGTLAGHQARVEYKLDLHFARQFGERGGHEPTGNVDPALRLRRCRRRGRADDGAGGAKRFQNWLEGQIGRPGFVRTGANTAAPHNIG